MHLGVSTAEAMYTVLGTRLEQSSAVMLGVTVGEAAVGYLEKLHWGVPSLSFHKSRMWILIL